MPALPKFPAEEFRKGQRLIPVSDGRARVGQGQGLRSCGRGWECRGNRVLQSGRASAALGTHGVGVLDTGGTGSVDPKYTRLSFLGRRVQMVKSAAKIPGDSVHTRARCAQRCRRCRVGSAASPRSRCSPERDRTAHGLLQSRDRLVPASSTRRSDGSSVLAPVLFRLRFARPQGSVRDASLHCPLPGRGVWRCTKYEPVIWKKPEVAQDNLGMEVGGRVGKDVQWD